jgi:hypothetical protein
MCQRLVDLKAHSLSIVSIFKSWVKCGLSSNRRDNNPGYWNARLIQISGLNSSPRFQEMAALLESKRDLDGLWESRKHQQSLGGLRFQPKKISLLPFMSGRAAASLEGVTKLSDKS